MLTIYRITDIPSTNPHPFGNMKKKDLNKVCLKSFVEAYRDIRPDIHFLADHCDKEIYKMIEEVVPFNYVIEESTLGINGTMLRSYDIASKVDDFVLMQECDYLYRPNIGKLFIGALEQLDIVSPYDHRNFYIDRSIHSPTVEIQLVNDCHFRTTERNTMTWGTHGQLIKEYKDIFDAQGYLDDKIWFDLWMLGRKLWIPIPSFATHCVVDYMAPGVEWTELWKTYQ